MDKYNTHVLYAFSSTCFSKGLERWTVNMKKLKGKPIDLIIIIVLLSLGVSLLHVVCKLQYSDEKHSYILYL